MAMRWMLLRANEDGNPICILDDAKLADLLANPTNWGVTHFADLYGLPDDHNYWDEKVGVLIRYEVVIPVPAGIYTLPGDLDG